MNICRNIGAKADLFNKAAEPNKESGANPEQGRCRILSVMNVIRA